MYIPLLIIIVVFPDRVFYTWNIYYKYIVKCDNAAGMDFLNCKQRERNEILRLDVSRCVTFFSQRDAKKLKFKKNFVIKRAKFFSKRHLSSTRLSVAARPSMKKRLLRSPVIRHRWIIGSRALQRGSAEMQQDIESSRYPRPAGQVRLVKRIPFDESSFFPSTSPPVPRSCSRISFAGFRVAA